MVKLPLVIACVKPVPGMWRSLADSWLVLGAVAVWFRGGVSKGDRARGDGCGSAAGQSPMREFRVMTWMLALRLRLSIW